MPMNPETKSHLHSLVDLHDQISQGKGDDKEADDIRDGMDIPCRKMSDNDTDIGSMISVLLYLLDVSPCNAFVTEQPPADADFVIRHRIERNGAAAPGRSET